MKTDLKAICEGCTFQECVAHVICPECLEAGTRQPGMHTWTHTIAVVTNCKAINLSCTSGLLLSTVSNLGSLMWADVSGLLCWSWHLQQLLAVPRPVNVSKVGWAFWVALSAVCVSLFLVPHHHCSYGWHLNWVNKQTEEIRKGLGKSSVHPQLSHKLNQLLEITIFATLFPRFYEMLGDLVDLCHTGYFCLHVLPKKVTQIALGKHPRSQCR